MTAGRGRLARFLGRWLTVAGVLAIGWWEWGFEHIPQPLEQLALAVLHALWERHWRAEWPVVSWIVYVATYLALWVLAPVWRKGLTALVSPFLWVRTSVRFTAAGTIILGPWWHRKTINCYEADAYGQMPIAFTLLPDPKLDERAAADAAFYRQVQYLVILHGTVQIPVTSFANKRTAEAFAQLCRFSFAYPLATPVPKSAPDEQAPPKTTSNRIDP